MAEMRERLSRLSQASLRINESLDVDTALRAVMDGARSRLRPSFYDLCLPQQPGSGHIVQNSVIANAGACP